MTTSKAVEHRLTAEEREALSARFPDEALELVQHKKKDGSPGRSYTSIRSAYVIERLNNVFGIGGWRYEIMEQILTEDEVMARIRLRVGGLEPAPAGGLQPEWVDRIPPIEQWGGMALRGGSTETDARKGSITSAISKAASVLGVGIDVFKGIQRAPGDGQGNGRRPSEGSGPKSTKQGHDEPSRSRYLDDLRARVKAGKTTWKDCRAWVARVHRYKGDLFSASEKHLAELVHLIDKDPASILEGGNPATGEGEG